MDINNRSSITSWFYCTWSY